RCGEESGANGPWGWSVGQAAQFGFSCHRGCRGQSSPHGLYRPHAGKSAHGGALESSLVGRPTVCKRRQKARGSWRWRRLGTIADGRLKSAKMRTPSGERIASTIEGLPL